MLVYKRFRYRIYPSKATVVRLEEWKCTLKFLWNIANEQRKIGYGRPDGEKIYPSFLDQQKELKSLRKEAKWIKDVPQHAQVKVLVDLDEAWSRCFDGISGRPRWKRKKNSIGITEFYKAAWAIEGNRLKFPKLPSMRIVISRPLEGKAKSCTIKDDRGQWFASILCEIEISDPVPRAEPKIGIDRGIRNTIADSDGRLLPNPRFLSNQLKRLARAQKTAARRKKGSKNKEKAYNKIRHIYRKIRRRKDHFLHEESRKYANSHGIVVLENLNVKGMIKNKQLSQHISDASWSRFSRYLQYKLQWSGGTLGLVNPAYTSQTCFACNHVDRSSRVGDRFKCTKCGHIDHADSNGAKVVLGRWSPSPQPVEGSSQRAPRRSRKFKSVKTVRVD